MWCRLDPDTLQNATLAALVCSAPPSDPSACIAICPNPDLAGVGVRTAFYLQSFMNALLVIFSHRDSVPSAWASTLLTASLVIAAMVQKGGQSITLHHATLTMNFATLSCIGSLAVAPTLPIWKLSPEAYYNQQIARARLVLQDSPFQDGGSGVITPKDESRIRKAQSKQRLFLALALLTQVVLQWAWGIVLFVSPVYSQTNCSGDTTLLFFLARFTARQINRDYMVVWVFWLLFSLGITLAMTVVLALTSRRRARSPIATSSRSSSVSTRGSAESTHISLYKQLYASFMASLPARKDRSSQLIFWYNVLAAVLWLIYIISAELQIQENCIFEGENLISSFGQITALLLAAQPMWSLTVALYRWPARQRREERKRKRQQEEFDRALAGNQPDTPPPVPAARIVQDSAHAHSPLSFPPRGRSRAILVAPERVAPAASVVAAPRHECGVPAATASAVRSRASPRAPSLGSVYIPRTGTEEWNELVSLTHLPRARDFS
ncbi:hypothetical protein C8Q78DRAFT_1131643 [Trametes maxima]|nr:hypothetical protein C8Q78DRAFT_1131643 [Trametes maxima]